MDAWLEWAPRMRAAHAEAKDNMSALTVAIQRTGCDVAQERMSELEHDMQPLAEEMKAVFRASALWEFETEVSKEARATEVHLALANLALRGQSG
jgi:hypothetical protein